MFFPLPTLLISPKTISFRKAPSIELMLKEGHNSFISCFVNFRKIAQHHLTVY